MGNCPTARLLGLVEAPVFASGQLRQLAFEQVAAQWREVVLEYVSLDMVVFGL